MESFRPWIKPVINAGKRNRIRMESPIPGQLDLEICAASQAPESFLEDVVEGLSQTPKRLKPMYFYDAEGSRLFEEICRLPEYYVTRTEFAILKENAARIVERADEPVTLVELGCGNALKTRLLIDALLDRQRVLHYLPVDISASMLEETSRNLLEAYSPRLSITAFAAEYNDGLHRIWQRNLGRKLVTFLGSNIGNFEPSKALDFLSRIAADLNPADGFLLGTDMVKEPEILRAAYNDDQGVTAAFNLHLLERMNRELDADFKLSHFSHLAFYNPREHRVEMHLQSRRSQDVRIGRAGRCFHFEESETIHTENSYKYTHEAILEMCAGSGLRRLRYWTDERGFFSLNLLARN